MKQSEAIKLLEEILGHEITGETTECTGMTETCPVAECMLCSVRDCPGNEPLHYHHDGCPYCINEQEEADRDADAEDDEPRYNVNATYYDDNFGHWKIEGPEDIEFYHQVQRESVEKVCQGCGRTVRLRPNYAYCNSCADKRERGYDI